jgi:signal transduction histidine kinase
MTICITVNKLKQIFELLLQRINDDNIQFIEVETDFYWLITSDVWSNFDSSPEAVVGSLIDDWNSLQEVLENKHIVTYLDYERFASILRAMSETIAPSKKLKIFIFHSSR